ncbi:MAG: DUF499 domain-containing protein [Actinomycetota bacterium]|nr:DUF499 domain-containing protein [Actinomycetota bacterium]MDQ6944785.1 DUF499 domain-containing protein [Actinomycetota bacterium]
MGPELYDVVEPRPDVLAGSLTDAVFAASLDEVVAGTAPDAYGKPADFFAATYPSAGLRSLLDEVLGRIGGGRPDGAPVVRLETNLGGGKTHNLIALYHAAEGHLDPLRAAEFMTPGLLPPEPVSQVAVFVGTATGATSFGEVAGVTPKTLWGYLALQLGGVNGYEELRSDDEHLTAPGAHALSRIMGGRPTLVLIDEIARYLAVAEGRTVGKGTLASQTTAFLMALMEAVASQPAAALVLTTTAVTDAFGEQTASVLGAIADTQSLIARKEHVLRPSDEADLPKILARRLFALVDPHAAAAVAASYATAAGEAFGRGADLPERMAGTAFATAVARSYPFHPDLITVLDKRLSTIPNFQRTRGALRLLARTVRLLWAQPETGTQLIHLHHIDLADKDTAEDLSSRLDKATLEPVIRADIASQPGTDPSHAEAVDARMGGSAATRLATTAYLWSLTRDVPGVPASTLIGGVLTPGDDPNVLAKALDNLEASAWYLHCDARGYRFSVEPSLAKLVQEAESQISGGTAKQAATDILARLFRDAALKVRRSWEDAKVPDRDDDAWLVVLHWDEFGGDFGVTDPAKVPFQVRDVWEKTPAGGLREYRNRVILLAPQARSHDAMLRTVRRHLALRELARSGDLLRSLPDEKRKEVADRARESELEARVAVCNHVSLLYVPQAGGLEPVELDVVTQAGVRPNQTDAVLDRLAAMEKTLAAGDKPLDPGWIASKLGAQLSGRLSTIELVRAFARRPDLKLVLDRAQITALISAGVRNGVWEYQDAERGDAGWATGDRHGGGVRIGDDTAIFPLGSAPPPAPVGGAAPLLPSMPVRPATAGADFVKDGKADVAVVAARQAAVDAGRTRVRELRLTIDELGAGTGTQLAKLLSVLPTTTPGATLIYAIQIGVALADPAHRLEATFVGPPAEYQPLRPGLDHVLGQHEATVKAAVTATFATPIDLSGQEFEEIRRRAQDTGPAKCRVTVTTEPG